MKHLYSLILLLLTASFSFAQWTKRSEFPDLGRNHQVTFSIDGIGYVMTGYNTISSGFTNTVHAYDPSTDTWTEKSGFGGGYRGFAYGASYNGKGYVGFGATNVGYKADLWEYDPIQDTWTQLATCPGNGRRHPAFAITSDGMLYVGLGDGIGDNGSFDVGFKDWWQYDIANNSWSQMPDLPAIGRHHPYFFAIGTDVYAGLGHSATGIMKDWYKFSSVTETWTVLSDFPGESRVAGTQFTYDGFGYIADGEGSDHQNLNTGEFYKYDHLSDNWQAMPFHIGDGLWAPGSFVVDDTVYVIGGDLDNDYSSKDLFAFSFEEDAVDNALSNDGNTYTLSDDFFDRDATFQWIDCANGNAPVTGETNATIDMPASANYALVVNYSAGGSDTSDCIMASSIDAIATTSTVRAYPNPVADQLTVNMEMADWTSSDFMLYDQMGRLIKTGRITSANNIIHFGDMNPGLYVLVVQTNESAEVLRIVKSE